MLAAGGAAACQPGPRDVAAMPHLGAAPPSLRVRACEDWSFTDELTTCSVEIAPGDLPALPRGYAWTEAAAQGTSHTVGGGPRVGPVFPVTRVYRASPPEFTHGGHLRIFTDEARRRAVVELYRE